MSQNLVSANIDQLERLIEIRALWRWHAGSKWLGGNWQPGIDAMTTIIDAGKAALAANDAVACIQAYAELDAILTALGSPSR